MNHRPPAIRAVGLTKRYGDATRSRRQEPTTRSRRQEPTTRSRRQEPTTALDGFDLAIPAGTVHGLLGPNGAGKTTAVRALATLLRVDSGDAEVAGFDVRRDPDEVRARIGLTGQYAAVDEILTGRQNLAMFGRLYHLDRSVARRRADDLLARFDLGDAADRAVGTYSGGMRRRLDLAASLVLAPEVLFLDEPTTGLDPGGRNDVWESVRGLVGSGTTVLLTTQYLEEADQLADRVSVMDRGRVIAEGTPDELKARVGGDQLEVTVASPSDVEGAAAVVGRVCDADPHVDPRTRRITAPVTSRAAALTAVVRELDAAGIALDDLGLRRPTLDDVFLQLTGRRTATEPDTEEAAA